MTTYLKRLAVKKERNRILHYVLGLMYLGEL